MSDDRGAPRSSDGQSSGSQLSDGQSSGAGESFRSGDGPPAFVSARDHVRESLVRFCRSLRRAGVTVPANAATTAARALVQVGFDDEDRARAALRACLVTEAEDIDTFDRQFPEFWRRLTAGLDPDGPASRMDDVEGTLAPLGDDGGLGADDASTDSAESAEDASAEEEEEQGAPATLDALGGVVTDASGDTDGEEVAAAWYSPTGDQSAVSSGDLAGEVSLEARLAAAFDELTPALGSLRGRRWQPRGDEQPDVRRALRASFGTGGTVVSVPRRSRDPDAIRALWLVDVSRSVLDTVDRAFLLATLRRARAEWRESRVVFFDEDAREVTGAFDAPSPEAALSALERAETEWGGGTQIGTSLQTVREQLPEAVDGQTAVFVVSDGLEQGDTTALERELAWLSRRARVLVWCNPLAAAADYEPTARGMAAALPFVDGLFAFAMPEDLVELGRQLRRNGGGGRIGYEYDPRRGTP
ncbi:MAG: VWA domain-containing protein [Haloglomus sp.]